MPLRLGDHCVAGNLKCAHMQCEHMGTPQNPVKTIHRDGDSSDIFQNELRFIEAETRQTKCIIKKSGHFAISESVEFYHGADLETATLRWSIGITPNGNLQIRDCYFNLPVFTAFVGGGIELEGESDTPIYTFLLVSEAERLYMLKSDLSTEQLFESLDPDSTVQSGPLTGKSVAELKQLFPSFSELIAGMLDLGTFTGVVVNNHEWDSAVELPFVPSSVLQFEILGNTWYPLTPGIDYDVQLLINDNYKFTLLFERAPRDIKFMR